MIDRSSVGVMEMPIEYAALVEGIKTILKNRYKLTAGEADAAIEKSPISRIFDSDPVMTSHTSNEAWAREIYHYWKEKR